jgi:hypothetical protein
MTLEAIKEAIVELPATEKTSLASWLYAQDSEEWNKQMEADFSAGGRGMDLLEQWDAEIQSGGSIPLEQFLHDHGNIGSD